MLVYYVVLVYYLSNLYASSNRAYFGPGRGEIFFDDMQCTGAERELIECAHTEILNHNCVHGEDAGVACTSEQTTTLPLPLPLPLSLSPSLPLSPSLSLSHSLPHSPSLSLPHSLSHSLTYTHTLSFHRLHSFRVSSSSCGWRWTL